MVFGGIIGEVMCEEQRKAFKENPKNKGKLYTDGDKQLNYDFKLNAHFKLRASDFSSNFCNYLCYFQWGLFWR